MREYVRVQDLLPRNSIIRIERVKRAGGRSWGSGFKRHENTLTFGLRFPADEATSPQQHPSPSYLEDPNLNELFKMSPTVKISSANEFNTLLRTSNVVITDCGSPSPSTDTTLTFPPSLRRLVWTMQGYCADVRVTLNQVLEAQSHHVHKGRRR
jgi:hypothetical protein